MASITRFYALVLSTVLLLSGVPGIFPNIVAFQPLVTFFALTLVHGVVHVAVGVLGLLITALASDESVRIYTLGIALLYGILAAVGLIGISVAPVLYFNNADNMLHGAIFILSLGVFLAGLAESRVHARRQRIIAALPESHWAIPSAPARTTGAPASMAHPPLPTRSSENVPDTASSPWFNPTLSQQSYQKPPSQPAPTRDPWTREQRRLPYGSNNSAASTPSSSQPASPRPQYPAPQWPPSQPSRSQPSRSQPGQTPSGWDAWMQNRAPADPQQRAPQDEQWPLDEWPSLDSRTR